METKNIMNESLVNDGYIINILPDDNFNDNNDNNDNFSNDNSDNNSLVSADIESQSIRIATKINTSYNSQVGLPQIDFKKLQEFYSKNNIVYKKNNTNTGYIKRETIAKVLAMIFIIILGFPIIFCDLYYAYTDNSCVNDYINRLNINMKTYLLVNGYYSLIIVFMIVVRISCISFENIDQKIYLIILPRFMEILAILFLTTWNIIGALIFWDKLYEEKKCDKNISNYLFVSLIIKLLSNSMALNKLKNK